MNISEYKNIFENEEEHFFYRANHEIFISLLEQYLPKNTELKILDAGCGTGLLAKKLEKYGKVTGVDISPEAIKFSKKREVHAIKSSITKLPFDNNTFDVITSIDVLYHRQVEDQKALKELYRVLKPGGIFLLRVPAHDWLLSNHDVHVHTRRRYEKKELQEKLNKAHFSIKKISYLNIFLLPIVLLKKFIEKRSRVDSSVTIINPWLNSLFFHLLSVEKYILKSTNIPEGIGLVVICTK